MLQSLYEILGIPFGWVIKFFYDFTGNYMLSVFFLTLIVKVFLLPAGIKQQKSIAMQQRLQPKLRRIKEKYSNDQQRIQRETQELYQREGYSSMGGGCLPMLIQFPVMIGLYQVNYHPFSWIMKLDSGVLATLKELVTPFISNTRYSRLWELDVIKNWDAIDKSSLSVDVVNSINEFISKFKFLGLNLATQPDFKHFDKFWIVPIVSGLIAFATAFYSLYRQKKNNPEMANNPSMGCMMFTTPVMQIWFAFMFTISVGIYIIFSSFISLLQMLVLNHIYSPKKVLARTMIDETIYRRSKEENTRKINEMKQD